MTTIIASKIDIISVNYMVHGEEHIMKPLKKSVEKHDLKPKSVDVTDANTNCKQGDTRCINHKLQRCVNIGQGQNIWMQTDENC
jgi:hypothetical protein